MINEQKKVIRKQIRQLKAQISLSDKRVRSEKILKSLEQQESFKNAATVMLYWSMDDEVFTHDFVSKWARNKRVILPCVDGDNLLLKEFVGAESLVEGENFGIPEPGGAEFSDTDEIDLIVVPGVAFDRQNNRMGRGRAYYDKLLKSVSAVKVGVCFDFQLLDNVPVDEHDVKMEIVISE